MKPSNLTEFCEMYSFNCNGNDSNLMILKVNGIFNREVYEALRHLHLFSNISQNKGNPWSLNVTSNSQVKANRHFLRDFGLYVMCYSSNLHLDDEAEPEVWNFNPYRRRSRNYINYFDLKLPANESLTYDRPPVVLFSVHSPFIQDDPTVSSNLLTLGHRYEISIRLVSRIVLLAFTFL
ncbi:uncharacterized protein NPIL_478611 [Nephila pilipes]|uniref:Uncharacterized protein n=1 Tax=Nephila pilipes TaxID=299642 RepID=A0A8X6QUT0_NEPPI|nr:uncharacterized protein NPIL_478611 [Nephila pilipes]